jgi:hypothetical protein
MWTAEAGCGQTASRRNFRENGVGHVTSGIAGLSLAAVLAAMPAAAAAQDVAKLCANAMAPELARMVLHWDRFNMFGNVKQIYSERGFAQTGEGATCRITSQRDAGGKASRACNWTSRMSCELEENKEPVPHTFSAGNSLHRGTLQWAGRESMAVKVKRGEVTTVENRDVAVVTFKGTWVIGSGLGESVSTAYYDRAWGVLLKIEGAHDANKFAEMVTLIEMQP